MILKSEKIIENAGVAQLVEQRSCNPERFRDVGSSPITSSDLYNKDFLMLKLGRYQSGQLGQTVNLLA